MNPPSALHGAMSRERKPFTYTPGGLDLSEIKSERMAKRLMRNAMNPGVSDTPVQTVQSPPASHIPVAIPNFNCLPVQVFPTFPLPANPKALLRTRSIPDQPKEIVQQKPSVPPISNNFKPSAENGHLNQTMPSYLPPSNNYDFNPVRPSSMYECNTMPSAQTLPRFNYGSSGYTAPVLPEISNDAEYFQTPSKIDNNNTGISICDDFMKSNKVEPEDYLKDQLTETTNITTENSIIEDNSPTTKNDNEQKEVKVVKKQVQKENSVENQNGDQTVEAAITVKLPTKKSSAKTETQVEVVKKNLPDGTVEEVKTTTTKTTIDGKTEISTKTETRILPKEEAEAAVEVVEEEDEEEEEEEEEEVEEESSKKIASEQQNEASVEKTEKITVSKSVEENNEDADEEVEEEEEVIEESNENKLKENGLKDTVITHEEKLESNIIKKVVVTMDEKNESEEEIEEEEVEEEVDEPAIKTENDNKEIEKQEEDEIKTSEKEPEKEDQNEKDVSVEEKIEEVEETVSETKEEEEEEEEVEEEVVSVEEAPVETQVTKEEIKEIPQEEVKTVEDVENNAEEEKEEEVEEKNEIKKEDDFKEAENKKQENISSASNEVKEDTEIVKEVIVPITREFSDSKQEGNQHKSSQITDKSSKQEVEDIKPEPTLKPEVSIPLREPSIPLEKVEEVEIKPIGEIIKRHTENTEIITTSTEKPLGGMSTQTEYNRIENIVTVNRTTKTLDHAYEQTMQSTIPPVKTYFPPSRILASPQPNRPYQPVYPPEPVTERRHSLLLERLSMERQLPPTDVYQNNYQYSNQNEERQLSQEPQSEVLTVSNVKPSLISKNQQWYQQTRNENVTYNNATPTATTPTPQWSQSQAQTQPQYQPQPQPQPQPQQQYQNSTQTQFQPPTQYQPTYTDNNSQESYISTTNNYQQNTYSTYTPKPTWVSTFDNQSNNNTQANQYSFLKKESVESSQKSTQQLSSSYVPPPWEQDPTYVTAIENTNQNYYQPPPPLNTFSPSSKPGWKPTPGKFSKSAPTAYIPPAPNQSFVKPVTAEPPKLAGRKTYYSEYERRYISVPETTYIPSETKYQAQPNPSPQYYYDNNEPAETVEPQWRKELREFTEKTSQTTVQTEQTVRPPWEEDPKYAKTTEYTNTTTCTQTMRPHSWRERSIESDYGGSKEWSKTNTLGRGRPQSSYLKSNIETIPERPRGVSVDRYNPSNYTSPAEYPPAQSHTLNPNIQAKTYHNPTVPAYHSRASAEPREQPVSYHQPRWGEARTPIQSRSFKYLQWITGTED